jgi:hypothetical protein
VDFLDAMNRAARQDHGDKASKEKAMSTTNLLDLPELAPVPRLALNEQDYYVDRVTDGTSTGGTK